MRPERIQIRKLSNIPGEMVLCWDGEAIALLHERPDGGAWVENLPLWEALTIDECLFIVRELASP